MMKKNSTRSFTGIAAAACLMYAFSAGLRSVYGIMLGTIAKETGVAYADVSFFIAVGQLVFGIAQPVFGVVALKRSNGFGLVTGCICIATGLVAIPFCRSGWLLMAALGILLPLGTGAVSFGMIMGAISPRLGTAKAASASGLVNASSGVGIIIFSPLIQRAFASAGLTATLLALGLLALVLIPVSTAVSGRDEKAGLAENVPVLPLIKQTIRDKNYIFLMIGFFTCGFHMAIIDTHLYSQILSYGIEDSIAAAAFSIYGLATVSGSLISGYLSSRLPMKYVVGTLYGSRVIWVLGFLMLPQTIPVVIGFAILLGLTGGATVTPTSGLVGKLFGARNLATLFGIVFLSHQCGSFLSAWLGGKCLEITGNYTLIWMAAAALSFMAMLVSYCIREE